MFAVTIYFNWSYLYQNCQAEWKTTDCVKSYTKATSHKHCAFTTCILCVKSQLFNNAFIQSCSLAVHSSFIYGFFILWHSYCILVHWIIRLGSLPVEYFSFIFSVQINWHHWRTFSNNKWLRNVWLSLRSF